MEANNEKGLAGLAVLKRFPAFMKGSTGRYLGCLAAMVIATAASLLTPLVVAATVDAITAVAGGRSGAPVGLPGPLGAWFDRRGGAGYLAGHIGAAALMLVGVSLVGGLFQYLRGKWSAEASEKIAQGMRDRLYAHLLSLTYGYHAKAQTGDLIQRCTTDVETVRRFLAKQIVEAFRAIVMGALALSLMSRIHVPLTFLSLILIPPIFALAFWFFHWVRKLFMEADEADGRLSGMLQETLTGVRVVRAFGRQRYESDRFTACADEVHDKSVRISRVMAVYWSGSDAMCMLQTGITLLFGITFAVRGEITAGNVLTFTSYITMLVWPIRQLGQILQDLGKSMVSMRRICDILDTPPEADTPGAAPADLNTDIEFRHVSFAYDPEHPVLRDVSFTAGAGQTVAILGMTGSGKSTLMHLLQRLYDPDGGAIFFGDREIRTIAKKYLRSRVGYVLQEPGLYSRTIGENIAIAVPGASRAQVERAARMTESEGFIRDFEADYETMVGERGVTLSGGQKQRVAMARTLLRENDVLILDDSLSAVDTQTDRNIRERLKEERRRGGRTPTTFIISHRVTTLVDADLILVLEDGRIAQQGTHEELIAREGLYRRVYRIQAMLEEELERETLGGDAPDGGEHAAGD
ncbi:MAG: ABC transporter ATP-binding protein [Clostridia bacterium]|nr:ABC transporter ATP-binding protein [Clostridia bacterium]